MTQGDLFEWSEAQAGGVVLDERKRFRAILLNHAKRVIAETLAGLPYPTYDCKVIDLAAWRRHQRQGEAA